MGSADRSTIVTKEDQGQPGRQVAFLAGWWNIAGESFGSK